MKMKKIRKMKNNLQKKISPSDLLTNLLTDLSINSPHKSTWTSLWEIKRNHIYGNMVPILTTGFKIVKCISITKQQRQHQISHISKIRCESTVNKLFIWQTWSNLVVKIRRTLKKSVAFQNIFFYELFKNIYDFTQTEHSLIRKCCLPSLLTYLFHNLWLFNE